MEMTGDFILDLLTLIVLFITMVFVIKYWAETQHMKKEMINQNNISAQLLKSSLLPVLDIVPFEKENAGFAYDIFIENKGNGPAFNINVQRLILPHKNKQKMALTQQTQGELEHFTRIIPMIGSGERIKIYRERSDSIEYFEITISYRDHFKDLHKSVLEGDRDGLTLKEYPTLLDHQKKEPGH